MDLLHLVDRLEELVAGAQKMPIGNRAILDRRRLLDLIDQMRIAVPREVREAQDIVTGFDQLRREAEEDARIIVARAEEQAVRMVEDHQITEMARHRADEIAVQAEARLEERIEQANDEIQARIDESRLLAQQQMDAADDYARELLMRLDQQLGAFVNSVRSGIEQLEPEREPPPDDNETWGVEDPAGYQGYERAEAYEPDEQEPAPADVEPAPVYTSDAATAGRVEPLEADEPPAAEEPADERREEFETWEPAAPQPEASGPEDPSPGDREPIPLRRDEGGNGDLENLLRRPPPDRPDPNATTPPDAPAEPGVIDDYSFERFDDEPAQRGEGDERDEGGR